MKSRIGLIPLGLGAAMEKLKSAEPGLPPWHSDRCR